MKLVRYTCILISYYGKKGLCGHNYLEMRSSIFWMGPISKRQVVLIREQLSKVTYRRQDIQKEEEIWPQWQRDLSDSHKPRNPFSHQKLKESKYQRTDYPLHPLKGLSPPFSGFWLFSPQSSEKINLCYVKPPTLW